MVEVFKTDVEERDQANVLIELLHKKFIGFIVNFDLEDCDRIMKVTCKHGLIQPCLLVDFLKDEGFSAEVLPD